MIESILVVAILSFGVLFYFKRGDASMHDYVTQQSGSIYDRLAPYSFKTTAIPSSTPIPGKISVAFG